MSTMTDADREQAARDRARLYAGEQLGMAGKDREVLLRLLDETRAQLERAQAASEGVDMLIAQAERRGAVKALREAAEVWYGVPGPKHPLSAVTWLYERATVIEKGGDL